MSEIPTATDRINALVLVRSMVEEYGGELSDLFESVLPSLRREAEQRLC